MKSKLIALIVIGVVLFGSFSLVYAMMYDCLNPPTWMKGPPTSFDRCWKLFLNGHLPDYSDDQKRYENKQFQNIMEKKAISAFNIKLDEYRYSVDTLTVQNEYRASDDHEFYIGYAATTNDSNYFLMTTFESEQSMDTMDVEIFKIISEKCTRNDLLYSSGCSPEHLVEAQKNSYDLEGLDSGWIAGEDYCNEWCDQEELYSMGCDTLILAHLAKYSNLLDEEFDGTYLLDWMGLPNGMSKEKFDWCVDFIYDKRTKSLENTETVFTGTLPLNSNPKIFSDVSTKFVNPNYESLKYYKTTQVIDDTYLGKNVQQWQDAWDWELESNYEVYKDEFYEELGGLLVKNEITQAMNQVGIINSHNDFEVHQGYSLTSLPPHVGFTTVINATDGNSYLIEASAHSNRVNYYAITQLQFFDTAEGLSLADILSHPQTIDVLPEDGHKSKAVPSNLIIHVDDNAVNFVNRTPEPMRIQESGTGEIAREHELTWIGPTIPPFGNDQVIFEKPGIYEWDARKSPTLENPSWWDSHVSGEIVVLADNLDDLPLEDRLHMGRAIIMNSEIPSAGMGIGNAEHALKISLSSAVYEMLPDAVQYYQDRAEQIIPFDIPIIIEGIILKN